MNADGVVVVSHCFGKSPGIRGWIGVSYFHSVEVVHLGIQIWKGGFSSDQSSFGLVGIDTDQGGSREGLHFVYLQPRCFGKILAFGG